MTHTHTFLELVTYFDIFVTHSYEKWDINLFKKNYKSASDASMFNLIVYFVDFY